MHPLVQKVLSDPKFPTHPRVKVGENLGKPEYQFFIPPEKFYEENGKVYADFVNGDGKEMRYFFYFGKYNLDKYLQKNSLELTGEFEMLIVGSEFI